MLTSLNDALLARLGLTTLDAVRTCTAAHLVKDQRGNRDVLRLDPPGSAPLFLKRVWRAHKKDGLASLLRHGAVWSVCRKEWRNYQTLQAAGIPTCPLIAFGEDTGPLWERFSFILTAAAPGQPLDDFIRTTPSSPLRRRTLDHLARHIRKMHDAGLYAPDLFTRHIFVSFPDFSPRNRRRRSFVLCSASSIWRAWTAPRRGTSGSRPATLQPSTSRPRCLKSPAPNAPAFCTPTARIAQGPFSP